MGADSRPWRAFILPLGVVTALSVAYLLLSPLTADHAAQLFRTELFERDGPVFWNNFWFGGHHLPTYSLLAPAIGSLIGFRLMGVLAVVGSALLFTAIVDRYWGRTNPTGAAWGAAWFSAAVTVSLFSGRITFALGVFLATLAVFLAQRNLRAASLVVAFTVALASPVAALFLACCGLGHGIAMRPDRRGLELAGAAMLSAVVIALLFPAGGDEPYVVSSFVPALVLTLAAVLVIPPSERLVRIGLLVYAAALVAAFLIPTPMGGNANRLGVLLTGPLVLCAAWPRRRLAVLVLAPLILAWQVIPVVRDLRLTEGEPSVQAGFYGPLVRTLDERLERQPARVEVLPVASHWESARLAPDLPLARGWERQTDRRLNGLFYEDTLPAGRYREWLDRLGVGWVAVPSAELDYSAEDEAALVMSRPGYLREVDAPPGWELFRVEGARPLVQPPARLEQFGVDRFRVSSPEAGRFLARVRYTPYWEVSAGRGCVEETAGGWTEVFLPAPGALTVSAVFDPTARFGADRTCRP